MKRLLLGTSAVLATAALAAASAAAGGNWSVSLLVSHTQATSHAVGITGDVLNPSGKPANAQALKVEWFANATCSGPAVGSDSRSTNKNGHYASSSTMSAHTTYSFRATLTGGGGHTATSACVSTTVTAAPGEDGGGNNGGGGNTVVPVFPLASGSPGSYLCWNSWMTDPVAYPDAVADAMWTTGMYLEPKAILGNVTGGTNIGAYHLVCNAPSTLVATDVAIGGSGELYSPAAVAAYHHDHPVNGNDLNIYHVWK